ncbi:DUF6538 domain-containing protein [Algirhabdus cladophorae]|uniref:DUF6538 domain-containing protein n=1 Tax=Algirhabdus cladophorae TaxID=3377108 RepID=UPI003B8485CC
MKLTKRGNTFNIVRRVPVKYQNVESREQVWLNLHTDSETDAKRKAPDVWDHQKAIWEARLAGESDDKLAKLEAARELASVHGFKFMSAPKVAALPVDQLLKRMEAVQEDSKGNPQQHDAAALLGGVAQPELTISEALEMYWTLAKDKTFGKSDDQIRKWRNPRIRAVKNLIHVIGDKALHDIEPDDTLDFRDWLATRIQAGEIKPSSANKDLNHMGAILKTVNTMKRLGLHLPLSDLSFKTEDTDTRLPFSDKWIKEQVMADGALDGLNDEARCIVLLMINTGARPSELAGLRSQDIHLTANIPHIAITPYEGHSLKNAIAKRDVPVTGVSLEAIRQFPDGFPRYAGSSASLSGIVNKYFRDNGLKETPDHTLYGLRHSFEDRMLAEPTMDERIRRDLMGHSLGRQRYGQGATLAHADQLLQAKAL